MSILFISDPEVDGHILPVASELGRRGHQVLVFDPGKFPMSASITVDSTACGSRTTLKSGNERADLTDIGSVWYRRPGSFVLPEELHPKETEWLRAECTALINGIYANTDALWVSEPNVIRHAELKLLQLRLAQQLGFRVPDYTVTNDSERSRSFLDEHPDGVITKGLRMPMLVLEDRVAMIYTHRVTEQDAEQLESVRYGPTFLQALIPKARDVRVTVIGDELFATAIESMTMAASQIDFRKVEFMDLPHVPVTLPEPVASACFKLVKDLGLQFGAIDLLETPDNDYVFLENNPNGQWYWIEMMTGQPMAKAMADLLERGEIERGRAPDESRAFTPAPRASHLVAIGSQTVPLDPDVQAALSIERTSEDELRLVTTRSWVERKREGVLLHVGDTAVDDA